MDASPHAPPYDHPLVAGENAAADLHVASSLRVGPAKTSAAARRGHRTGFGSLPILSLTPISDEKAPKIVRRSRERTHTILRIWQPEIAAARTMLSSTEFDQNHFALKH